MIFVAKHAIILEHSVCCDVSHPRLDDDQLKRVTDGSNGA